MAKIASSKPYGSGKNSTNKTPTRSSPRKADKKVEADPPSPIRTSPRRRKSISEAIEAAPIEVEPISKAKPTKKPSPPKFSDSRKTKRSPKTPKMKTTGRRKSSAAQQTDQEAEPEQAAEEEKIIDYVQSVYEGEGEDEDDSHSTSLYKPSDENSPVFEESVPAELEEEDYIEEDESYEEEDESDQIDDEESAFHFDEEEDFEDTEGYNSQILDEEYNDRFRYTSNTVRERLAKYFQNRESGASVGISVSRAQVWNRMKEWFNDSLLPSAKELGGITFDLTKKAIENISKRLEKREEEENTDETQELDVSSYEDEPQIFEITDDQEDYDREGSDHEMFESEIKRSKVDGDESFEQAIDSVQTSYHSIEVENIQTQSQLEVQNPQTKFIEPVEVLQSRLTEIILFLAQCTHRTPIQSIFEYLEELFELKAANPLNYTEKQLVAKVIRDYLTERDDISETLGREIPTFEPVVLTSSMNESPKRIKILPDSGIRFRAPKFTAEEEARFEDMERKRKVNSNATSSVYSKATGAKNKLLQKKLLAPESIAELIEELPENRARASALNRRGKEDNVNSAIEDIIAQKMKETKKKEEEERLETEKLRARVAELEREARERSTKEALLQKQLEEQKKELEIEKAAAKAKLESLKKSAEEKPAPILSALKPSGASNESKPVMPFASFNFGSSDKLPVAPVAPVVTETSPSKGANSFGFSFGNSSGAGENVAEIKAPLEKAPAFGSFAFGAAKTTEDKPAAFNFGAAKTEEKPTSFSFGNAKAEEKPASFSFGAAKTEDKLASTFSFGTKTEDKPAPPFNFGAKPDEKPVSTFSFGSKAEDKPTSAFSFGAKVDDKASSAFSFGAKTEEKPAATFSFGSKAEESAFKPAAAFSFGTSKPEEKSGSLASAPFNFVEKKPQQSAAPAFGGFNSFSSGFAVDNNSAKSATSSGSNPFAALNSAPAGNIFSNTNSFSFGTSAAPTSATVFSFPPLTSPLAPAGAANPIIPMNFGGPSAGADGGALEMSFAPGNRQISIPKRKRK